MILQNVLEDYRSDWLERCIEAVKADMSSYAHLHLFFCSAKRDVLYLYMKKILKEVSAFGKTGCHAVNDLRNITLPDSVGIVWADSKTARDALLSHDLPAVVVSADMETFRDLPQNAIGLYTGKIYGAGMEAPGQAEENNCTNVIDMFSAQLFMAAHWSRLPGGVYYAGHGKAPCRRVSSLEKYGYKRIISLEDGRYMLKISREEPNRIFYFDNTYNGQLGRLHKDLKRLLLEFDRICRKNNICYYLGGGTLLGAVRHGGLIPWDDDVDVMMTREEYEKFLRVVNDDLSEGMFFQSNVTDPYYHSVFTKIRLDGTKFITRFSQRFPDMHQGVFIDIFVHDKTSGNRFMQKVHVFETLFARSMVFHKWEGTPMQFYGKFKLLCFAATVFIKHTGMKRLELIQEKVIEKYKGKKTGMLYDGTGEHLKNGAFPEKWLGTPKYLMFDGHLLPVPEYYKEYLVYSYGNFEKLIPASKRKAGHDIVDFEFGKS